MLRISKQREMSARLFLVCQINQRKHFSRKDNDIQEKFACCYYLIIWLILFPLHQQMYLDMI